MYPCRGVSHTPTRRPGTGRIRVNRHIPRMRIKMNDAKRIYPIHVRARMMTNDAAFVSSRKRLVGVCDTPLPGYTNTMRLCMTFVFSRKRLVGVCDMPLPGYTNAMRLCITKNQAPIPCLRRDRGFSMIKKRLMLICRRCA